MDVQEGFFKKGESGRLGSPEQLDSYLKLSQRPFWIFSLGILLLCAGILFWFFFGKIPSSVEVNGIVEDGKLVCYLSEAEHGRICPGMLVKSRGKKFGEVLENRKNPFSETEVSQKYGSDYLKAALCVEGWNYEVIIQADSKLKDEGTLYPLVIEEEEKRPFELLVY